jgi:hypothetical protein
MSSRRCAYWRFVAVGCSSSVEPVLALKRAYQFWELFMRMNFGSFVVTTHYCSCVNVDWPILAGTGFDLLS